MTRAGCSGAKPQFSTVLKFRTARSQNLGPREKIIEEFASTVPKFRTVTPLFWNSTVPKFRTLLDIYHTPCAIAGVPRVRRGQAWM
jgi:hypothetical protein